MIIYKVQFYEYNSYSYDGVIESDARYFKNRIDAEKCQREYVDNYTNDFGNRVKCPDDLIPTIEEIRVK